MPKKKHPFIKALRFKLEKIRAKDLMARHGIKGEIPEYLLTKPDYQMSFHEYCNFHLVPTILKTDNASEVYAKLQADHIAVILKAIEENKVNVPLNNLDIVISKYYWNKLYHPKESGDIKRYLKNNGLKIFGGEVVKKKD